MHLKGLGLHVGKELQVESCRALLPVSSHDRCKHRKDLYVFCTYLSVYLSVYRLSIYLSTGLSLYPSVGFVFQIWQLVEEQRGGVLSKRTFLGRKTDRSLGSQPIGVLCDQLDGQAEV